MSFRRVLIAPDPAAPRDEWLDAVIALGAGGAELVGLYVEDAALLRVAGLPCAREVRSGAPSRGLDATRLGRQLQQHALAMQQAMERAGQRRNLQVQFSIRRGEVTQELIAAAADADLLVIGRSRHSAGPRSWLGSAPERLLDQPASSALLFIQEPWATGRCVLAVPAPGPAGDRALSLARALATAERLPLVTLDQGPGTALPPGVARCSDAGVDSSGQDDAGALLRLLRHACRVEDPRVLVLPRERLPGGGALATLVSDLRASVMVTP